MRTGEVSERTGSPYFGPRDNIDNNNSKAGIDSADRVRIRIKMNPKGIDAQHIPFENADSIGRRRQFPSPGPPPSELGSTNRAGTKQKEKRVPEFDNADNTRFSCSPRPRYSSSEPRSTNQTEQLKRKEKMDPGFDRVDNIRPPRPPSPPRPRSFSPEPKRREKMGSGFGRVDNTGPPCPPSPPRSRAFSPQPKRRERMRSDIGYIWPKDPRPGNTSRWFPWQRFTDVMTGKGPDIYVGRIRPRASHHDHGHTAHMGGNLWGGRDWERRSRTGWSLWENDHAKCCTRPHCPDCYNVRKREKRDNLLFGARRDLEERYDFRTRRYQVPDEGTWSRVEYCDERRHTIPLCYWDRYGRPYPAAHQHDGVYGGRCRRFRY